MNDIILTFRGESYSLFKSDDFIVENIENLTWGQNELALTENPYLAGDTVQNNRGMARDITVSLKPTKGKGDYGKLIHKFARMQGSEITLTWKNRTIPSYTYGPGMPHTEANLVDPLVTDLTISGTVNEFETPRFEDKVLINFTVHCSNPYWETPENIISTYDSGMDAIFCNYGEVQSQFKIEIPDFNLHSTGAYYDISIGELGLPEAYTLSFYALSLPSSGILAYDHVYVNFEKGKVSIRAGASEDTAVNVASKIAWKMFRPVFDPESGTYTDEEIMGMPFLPFSSISELIPIRAIKVDASAAQTTEYVVTTIRYTEKFL